MDHEMTTGGDTRDTSTPKKNDVDLARPVPQICFDNWRTLHGSKHHGLQKAMKC